MSNRVLKISAKRIGTTPEEYLSRVFVGEKWCTACKAWHTKDKFSLDRHRTDGLRAACSESRKQPAKSAEFRFLKKVRNAENGCLEWTGSRYPSGYGSFYYKGKVQPAHRVAWMLEKGEIPDSLYVLHRCDNRKCVRVDHLFLGTHLDNMRDMDAKGRRHVMRGSTNPKSKLTLSQVKEVRELCGVVSQQKLADRFGVSKTAIRYIQQGRNWSEFPEVE